MTKRQQQALLQQAIGASLALSKSTATSTSTSGGGFGGGTITVEEGDDLRVPAGGLNDLSVGVDTNPDTGFYFPDGQGFVVVLDGQEIFEVSPEGVTINGTLVAGDSGTDDVSSDLTSNVLGVTVSRTATQGWSANQAIEFATYPLEDTPTGFFAYISEDNGTVSKSDKIYFFSLKKPAATTTYRCVASLLAESGPTFWDLVVKAEVATTTKPAKATFYVRRSNGSGAASVSVTVMSVAQGAVGVKAPVTITGGELLGLEVGQYSKKIIIADPTNTGYNAFTTKQNDRSETGTDLPGSGTGQDKTRFSLPSASPALSNGVTTENTTDTYEARVKWVETPTGGDKIYDLTWVNERFAPNYVPNDPGTGVTRAAHQHKMEAGANPTAQTFIWPRTAPANGTYLLQSTFASGTHTLAYTGASSLTNAVQNGDAPNGIKTIRQVTQAFYTAIANKDPNTLYIIV